MKKLKSIIDDTNRKYYRKKHKVNTKIKSITNLPRLIVNKSNKYNYVQLVDQKWYVIASSNDMKITEWTKLQKAELVWKDIASKLISKWVEKVVFDRNWYLFHWRVKAIADWARSNWLKF